MKAGIFDPYLDTLGGGERYCLSLAEILLEKNWQVDLFWRDKAIKKKLIERFGLKLEKVNFVNYSPAKLTPFQRKSFEEQYHLLFYISDGSLPFMFGKRNFLHFQVPFKNISKKGIIGFLKLKRIEKIICNSFFTKKVIDQNLGTDSVVVYPPVDIDLIKPLKKENLILCVGRFSQLLQNKRQDVLVEAFKKMINSGAANNWRLTLAGGSEIGGKEFVSQLKKMAGGYPIEIIENPPLERLLKLYGKAKIYWGAAGFGIDEEKEPEKVEHFGISTVEAMAAGCVVVVQAKGGQKEIVENRKNGFLWKTEKEIISLTSRLLKETKLMQQISQSAMLRSKTFTKKRFGEEICRLIDNEN
ncbi:MAG TPA: glycosyltransferase family 4 protein [Clostridia bacterium]|nr:glycosyltransferase family 4 protein [Clostridia bacterium]